ncbi:serine/threonine protein kinase [Paenibacillus rhizovicinus]|uniref:Serine/threonine protein kinase n=1 Tax=Paenibacillus rhizovicinus TaxID=2704463 RepID=A0A6C0P3G6_9BACL|nr:serine/threonine protein kinase [Paenibacillus rhizovicinus]QHW33017.1 serine/threonine protein kinase [Paenibacillus rhizovicinus]
MHPNDCPLATVQHVEESIVAYLSRLGNVFKVFDQQDSGCISYGVHAAGRKWFVKYSERPEAIVFLRNAAAFHGDVQHPLIPKLLNVFKPAEGLALVYEWVSGEVLGTPEFPGAAGRNHPDSPHYRFRQLPAAVITAVLSAMYDLHVYLERRGYVAVDWYDGCMIYDFERSELHLCDFDYYVKGAFVLEMDRLFGSSRFMAPEEFVRGSRIDHVTNVYTMGAAAFVFLAEDGSRDPGRWRASERLYQVALKAASPDREKRYGSISEFHAAWLAAI